ncbi:alpha/beta fold hydrolase [Microbacterium gorillae]|uniref:alpha/beta fold hydrolase n=1 Tax=Microbacterium gorillae TaxID=1231063 RepID=UPI00058F3EEB|nr:alpha/beta fold hydrolase [Microbacterium gorillae]
MPTVRRAYADTPLGQIHFAEAGTGDPLILLHQTPRSHDEFREVMPLLAGDRRVIAPDMIGFGLSAKPDDAQSIELYARGVVALADALGLTEFAVLGHHTGMFVAVEVAAMVPDRVTAAVFSGAELGDAEFRADTGDGGVDDAPRRPDGSHLTTLWAQRLPFYPPDRPDILDRFIHDALAPGVDPREGHEACARYRMEDRLDLVRAPLLVLAAPEDPFSYPHRDRVAAAFPHAPHVQTVDVPGGGIPLMEVKPAEVAAAVTAFLATAPVRN